jgi:hypothetical protein
MADGPQARTLKPGHEQVWLETASGGFVPYAEIPFMRPCPGIILWGERFFTVTNTYRPDIGGVFMVYRETITWVAQDPTPYNDPLRPVT